MDMINTLFSLLVNRSRANLQKNSQALPPEQQAEVDAMMEAVQSFIDHKNRLAPEYQGRAIDMVIMRADEVMKSEGRG